jgi:hypothetical protein
MLLNKMRFLAGVVLIGGVVAAGAAFSKHVLSATLQQEQAPAGTAQPAKPAPARVDGRAGKRAGEETKVRTLLREKLATLRAIVEQYEKALTAGGPGADVDDLLRAKVAVCAAELELCQADKQRIKILRKTVEVARERETVAQRRLEATKAFPVDVLTRKAERLDAEIALERAMARAAAEAK